MTKTTARDATLRTAVGVGFQAGLSVAQLSSAAEVDPLLKVLADIASERKRQDAKWGEQNCHDFEWISILTEEVGEAARAANEANFESGKTRGDFAHLREELVQVAAVAAQWVEAIDRRSA